MLVRILAALGALACAVQVVWPQRGDAGQLDPSLQWFWGSMLAVCAGMVVPWRRVLGWQVASPGRNLAVCSKLLGWMGACFLPGGLVWGQWAGSLACAFLLGSSVALWQLRPWAAWMWYAVAAGCILVGVTFALGFAGGPAPDTTSASSYAGGALVGRALGTLFWCALGVVIAQETRAWRRRLGAGSQDGQAASR